MPPQNLLETYDTESVSNTDFPGLDFDQDEDYGPQETIAYWLVGSFIIDQKLADGSFIPTPSLDLNVFRVFLGWYMVNQVSKTINRDCLFDDLD